MARIRTIKPEFPQSESIGRLSRDARLLFIQLWTICDDEGRTRAASRMLASLLYPYDDDAPGLIDGWIAELDREGCIELYSVAGSTYLHVTNWVKHQKIDRASGSKLPAVSAGSRIIAQPREDSRALVLGPGPGPGPRTEDGPGSRGLAGQEEGSAPNGAAFEVDGPIRPDPKTELYRRAHEVLGKNSGGCVTKLLKAKDGSVALARAAIEQASEKHNPAEYIGAIIRNKDPPRDEYRDGRI